MTHVDLNRKRGGYCAAPCALCYLAAVWLVQGRENESDALLRGRGPSQVAHHGFVDDASDIDIGLVGGLIDGTFVCTGLNGAGELLFRLTDKGRDDAFNLVMDRPDMRDLFNRMSAAHGVPPMADPPKDKQ